jgi:3-oxoacyl-[acyl-carrier protein] reductase
VTSAVADVSDEASVRQLVAATLARFGKIDILVNNAALFAPLQEQPSRTSTSRCGIASWR